MKDALARATAIYCPHCERPGAKRTALGYLGNDGSTGTVAGVACRACGYIQADADASPIITGYLDLGGRRAIDWFVTGLRAAGCNPRPRR
jgi:hypothetical protein